MTVCIACGGLLLLFDNYITENNINKWYYQGSLQHRYTLISSRKTEFQNIHSSVMCLDSKLKWTVVGQQITKLAKLLLLDICEDTWDADGFATKMSQLTLLLFFQQSLISLSFLLLTLSVSLSASLWGRYFRHTSSLNHRPARLCEFRKCLQSTHTHTHALWLMNSALSILPSTVNWQGLPNP